MSTIIRGRSEEIPWEHLTTCAAGTVGVEAPSLPKVYARPGGPGPGGAWGR